jgi:DNA-binding response OmpR family regulator
MTTPPDLQKGFEFGPFSVLPERNIVFLDKHESHLEPKQMTALVTLAKHQPGVVSKQMLIDAGFLHSRLNPGTWKFREAGCLVSLRL